MGIGYRKRDGVIRDGEVCLLVWVKRKLAKSEIIKESQLLPEVIDGVPVDVLEGEVAYLVCLSLPRN